MLLLARQRLKQTNSRKHQVLPALHQRIIKCIQQVILTLYTGTDHIERHDEKQMHQRPDKTYEGTKHATTTLYITGTGMILMKHNVPSESQLRGNSSGLFIIFINQDTRKIR